MRAEVQAWYSARSFRGRAFDRQDLGARKQGQRISVVLPAKNEAATIGAIITALRTELMEELPLLDEIIVIDSNSTDDTSALAAAAGATIAHQDQILPDTGCIPGKGEALWKSLAIASGDIVVFIDADLQEFDAQFAVGLLGPLLTNPQVHFVKSYYDRPLNDGVRVMPCGGGRVTELVARPLLNLFWPELAGVVQPLAGEYAGRRSLLECIPFVSGYGVEIGMLIDVLETVGLDGMAQVDLGKRRHRNSTDGELAKMAMQIQLTVQSRLHRRGLASAVPSTVELTQFLRNGESYIGETAIVGVSERPPMLDAGQHRSMTGERA
ncbi:glucosyl-3-phosphoglycerate synthase [Arthrobacter pityocampae]|uniref:Glucosyl-3-phosphoglycerate synthase n=1 Tax=Arthrobacter pityocampae TaxID=547334 RepID=A0A2S5J0S6_9MICC|nr:glucosyl-3-phosphoglycerate synthase [Arthrobacter pityocampae]PPB50393.1 glucosyl-3-phosphoglycerate synthase [Arthrobacter pityocampae]